MELRHLRYFAAIAEVNSFTRAAERLRVTQPALSRQIRDLEDEVGQVLLERLNHGTRLTAAGTQFLRGAKRLLAASDALLAGTRGANGKTCPPLRISHFGPLSAQHIAPYLRRLVRRFPSIHLEVDEEVPAESLRRLRTGTLDASLIGLGDDHVMRGLEAPVVWVAPQQILVASNHRFAKRRRVALAELRDETWGIWNEKTCPGFSRHALESCRRAGFRMRVGASFDSLATIFMHVAENRFISYAPWFAHQWPHPGVEFIPPDPPEDLATPVCLAWQPDSPHGAVLRWLAETMQPVLAPKGWPVAGDSVGGRSEGSDQQSMVRSQPSVIRP